MATAESARSALLSHLPKSAKRFCALKDVKDSVCKWYPSLEVEVLAVLLLHVTRYSIFSNSSIILPGLQASIGVTHSYSSRSFLCALGQTLHDDVLSLLPVSILWVSAYCHCTSTARSYPKERLAQNNY